MQTNVVAKSLVFNSDQKVLLLRRAAHDIYRPGGFDLPGGAIEAGEEFTAGALREIAEETGLKIHPASVHLVYSTTKPVHSPVLNVDVSVVRLFFACKTDNIKIAVNPEEHDAYYWCDLEEAAAKTDHPVHKELLNYVRGRHIMQALWSNA